MSELREKMIMEMELRNFSERTKDAYVWHVARYSKMFGRSPDELGEEEVKRYLHYLRVERKASWSGVNVGYSALKFFYVNVLHREWRMEKIPRPKGERKLPVVLSQSEVKAIIDSITNVKHRVIIATIYSSGLRISEVCRLRISDIDSGRMQIRVEEGKGKRDRYTLLSEKLLKELREYYLVYHPKEWLFTGKDDNKPIDVGTIQKVFKRARDKVGINKKVTVHTLRHSFATHLLESGANIFAIKELLGHSSVKTTAIYIHIRKQHIQKIVSPYDTEEWNGRERKD